MSSPFSSFFDFFDGSGLVFGLRFVLRFRFGLAGAFLGSIFSIRGLLAAYPSGKRTEGHFSQFNSSVAGPSSVVSAPPIIGSVGSLGTK